MSKETNENMLNLLLIIEGVQQYCVYIKNFNRFMFHQNKNSNGKHFCMHYPQCFSSDKVLKNHKEVCVVVNGKQANRMPKPGSAVKYGHFRKQLNVPFAIHADVEAIAEKISSCTQVPH